MSIEAGDSRQDPRLFVKDSLRKSDFHFRTFLFIIRDQSSTPAAGRLAQREEEGCKMILP